MNGLVHYWVILSLLALIIYDLWSICNTNGYNQDRACKPSTLLKTELAVIREMVIMVSFKGMLPSSQAG